MTVQGTTLASRLAVAATEGAAVVEGSQSVLLSGRAVAALVVTLHGTTTTYAVRADIEGSVDGTNWHLLVRFKDITNAATGNRIVRLPGVTAAATADIAADALGSAEGTGTQVDTPWPMLLRASTRLVTLTGGGNVDIAVIVQG